MLMVISLSEGLQIFILLFCIFSTIMLFKGQIFSKIMGENTINYQFS